MRTLITGLAIPFIGTAAGSACVFFLRKELSVSLQRALTGFAAGVMVAASIWSLIVPAIEQSQVLGRWAFLPAFLGFWLGILFLLLLDHLIPHLRHHLSDIEAIRESSTRDHSGSDGTWMWYLHSWLSDETDTAQHHHPSYPVCCPVST